MLFAAIPLPPLVSHALNAVASQLTEMLLAKIHCVVVVSPRRFVTFICVVFALMFLFPVLFNRNATEAVLLVLPGDNTENDKEPISNPVVSPTLKFAELFFASLLSKSEINA